MKTAIRMGTVRSELIAKVGYDSATKTMRVEAALQTDAIEPLDEP